MSWVQQARFRSAPKARKQSTGRINLAHREEIKPTGTPLLFVAGEYPVFGEPNQSAPFWQHPRHTIVDTVNGRRYIRTFMCTRGADRRGNCPACVLQYEQEDKRFNRRMMTYFTVIDLSWHVRHTNKYGDIVWTKPSSPGEERRLLQEEGAERIFGRKGYLALGPGHRNQLFDLVEQIQSKCSYCVEPGKRQAKLTPARYVCSGCEMVFEDMETTMLSGDELKELSVSKIRCSGCGRNDLPKIEYNCSNDCEQPTPTEIFDVVIPLAKRGTGTDTMLAVTDDITMIDDFEMPDGTPLFDSESEEFAVDISPVDFAQIFNVEMDPAYQEGIIERAGNQD